MINYNNIVEIRLLPNAKSVFPHQQELITYLTGRWTQRGGIYYFPKTSMKVIGPTLIFFQYDGVLIASAVLLDSDTNPVVDEDGNRYGGQYKFDPQTLCIFDCPINASTFSVAYPELGTFSQAKRKIPIDRLDAILEIVEKAGPNWVNASE